MLTHNRGAKGIHTFLKGIIPKVNIIAQLEFELAYYDVTVQYVSYYASGTIPIFEKLNWIILIFSK